MSKIDENNSTQNCSEMNKFENEKLNNEQQISKKSKNIKKLSSGINKLKTCRDFPFIPIETEWFKSLEKKTSSFLSLAERKKLIIQKFKIILSQMKIEALRSNRVYTLAEDIRNLLEIFDFSCNEVNDRKSLKRMMSFIKKKFPVPERSETALAVRYQSLYRHIGTEELEKIFEEVKVKGMGCYLNSVLNSEGNFIFLSSKKEDGNIDNHLILDTRIKNIAPSDKSFDSKSSSIQILNEVIIKDFSKPENSEAQNFIFQEKPKEERILKIEELPNSILQTECKIEPLTSNFKSEVNKSNEDALKCLKTLSFPENDAIKILNGLCLNEDSAKEFLNGNKEMLWEDLEDKILSKFKRSRDLDSVKLLVKYKGIDNVKRRIEYLIGNLKQMEKIISN